MYLLTNWCLLDRYFLSNIITLKISEKEENVLPREVIFDPITDQPIHIDFLRIVKGIKIRIEIMK